MTWKEILNRLGGSSGCDLITSGAAYVSPRGINSLIIVDDDTIISEIKDKDGVINKDGEAVDKVYIGATLPKGIQITFARPIVEVTLSAGRATAYFS